MNRFNHSIQSYPNSIKFNKFAKNSKNCDIPFIYDKDS